METNRLRQFRVLAETKNLREAANLLRITHAGLAKSIRVLEDELGIPLLTRDGRGIKITAQAANLLADMTACLETEDRLRRKALGIGQSTHRRVTLGTFEVFSTYFAPELTACFPEGTEVRFEELIPGPLEEAIAQGRVDFGITYLTVPRGELDHVEVTKIRMGVYGLKKFAGPKDFKELPFVVPLSAVGDTPNKVRGLDGWPDDRIPRTVRYAVGLMETAMALLRSGQGVAYLPKFIAERHNGIVRSEFALHELASPMRAGHLQPVYALKRKDREETGSFRAVCKAIRTLK
ncbi:MAG: LysR family transcriptional regulator [Bdellovibrionales bacterium]|nr:LysR family transcriptional regulator [Bdellovibrionales bacterium]